MNGGERALIFVLIFSAIFYLAYKVESSKYTPCRCGTPGCFGCQCGAMSNGTYRECKCGRCTFSDSRGAIGTCV